MPEPEANPEVFTTILPTIAPRSRGQAKRLASQTRSKTIVITCSQCEESWEWHPSQPLVCPICGNTYTTKK